MPRDRDLVTRGPVVELAVAVVVALALVNLLRSLVVDVVTPLVGVAGGLDFGRLAVTLNGSQIRYGAFLDELLSFLLTAGAIFFGVVKPLSAYQRRRTPPPAPPPCASGACRRCPLPPGAVPSAPPSSPRSDGLALAGSSPSGGAAAGRAAGCAPGPRGGRRCGDRPLARRCSLAPARGARRRHAGPRGDRPARPTAAAADGAAPPVAAVPRPRPRTACGWLCGRGRRASWSAQATARRRLARRPARCWHCSPARPATTAAPAGTPERVRACVDLLGEALHLPAADRERLRWAALVHDVGRTSLDVRVLRKPARLDEDEWRLVREHPAEGARLAEPLRPFLGGWFDAIAQHHERWDGTGYPLGLAGERISRGARIVAVADALEVMTANRPYQRPVDPGAARAELVRCSGTQFDPAVVRALLGISLARLRRVLGPAAWCGVVATTTRPDPDAVASSGSDVELPEVPPDTALDETLLGAVGLHPASSLWSGASTHAAALPSGYDAGGSSKLTGHSEAGGSGPSSGPEQRWTGRSPGPVSP